MGWSEPPEGARDSADVSPEEPPVPHALTAVPSAARVSSFLRVRDNASGALGKRWSTRAFTTRERYGMADPTGMLRM